ncbi:MAG: sulfurtransferase [bacterium]|nr:sulfurtransferase [bacterium]
MKDISVSELARWRDEQKDFVLLDVREPGEVATAAIPGALVMSMRTVPARLHELPKDRPIAVLCHHGGRSFQVARFLQAQGFADVVNVDGGIDAYAAQIDRTIPRY